MRAETAMIWTLAAMGLLGSVACGASEQGVPDERVASPEAQAPTAAAAPIEAARPSTLLLSVELEPGHAVMFYEVEPGAVFSVEQMQRGQKARLGETTATSLLDIYAFLRPGEAVPQVLRDAHARVLAYEAVGALAAGPDAPATGVGAGSPSIAQAMGEVPAADALDDPELGASRQAQSSSSAANFVNTHSGCRGGTVYSACRVNWGGGFFAHANARVQWCGVDHYAGDGVLVRLMAGQTIFDHQLPPNTFLFYRNNHRPDDTILRRLDILNATGDSFHVGCYWGSGH